MSFELFCTTEYIEFYGGLKSLFPNCHFSDKSSTTRQSEAKNLVYIHVNT